MNSRRPAHRNRTPCRVSRMKAFLSVKKHGETGLKRRWKNVSEKNRRHVRKPSRSPALKRITIRGTNILIPDRPRSTATSARSSCLNQVSPEQNCLRLSERYGRFRRSDEKQLVETSISTRQGGGTQRAPQP